MKDEVLKEENSDLESRNDGLNKEEKKNDPSKEDEKVTKNNDLRNEQGSLKEGNGEKDKEKEAAIDKKTAKNNNNSEERVASNNNPDENTEENSTLNDKEETVEDDPKIDIFIVEHLPEFPEIMKGLSQKHVDKVQNWLKEKLQTGIKEAKALEMKERKERENTTEKLKEKYGDNYLDVKSAALSILPEGIELDSKKELETIEKLYETYKKIEVKPPIISKTYKPNFWESGKSFFR